jgi:hypothetical protein
MFPNGVWERDKEMKQLLMMPLEQNRQPADLSIPNLKHHFIVCRFFQR